MEQIKSLTERGTDEKTKDGHMYHSMQKQSW